MLNKVIAIAVLSSIAACGPKPNAENVDEGPLKDNPSSAQIDRNIEGRLTISRGLYGQTTAQDDTTGNAPVKYWPMTLTVSEADSSGAPKDEIATVKSDDHGFYEVALDEGAYVICTTFKRCVNFNVVNGTCVRLDYEFSNSPGWFEAQSRTCPGR